MTRQVLIHSDKDALISEVAGRVIRTSVRTLARKSEMHLVLTGGSVGIGILAAINSHPERDSVEWARMHFWWGDERWVPTGHEDRNDRQAREALLDHIACAPENVHQFPASDSGLGLDEAAARYTTELADAGASSEAPGAPPVLPHFDLLLLGVGPDGHIASLFPDRADLIDAEGLVVPVRNSPKPPPERISLTFGAINSAERVWLALAGADKASALGLALAGVSQYQVPAAGAAGRRRTVFFVDQAAAAEVPEELIASEY